ncbi:hypothetical protein JCM5350_004432 [Sporobolomyces pararoseus]
MSAPLPPSPSNPMGSIPILTPPPIPGIQQLKKDLTASVDYLVAMTAIMIWDVISTFPSEFRYVWKTDWNYLKIFFFLNRYGSLVLQILNMSLVVAKVSPQFCQDFFWFHPFVGTYVLTICGVIFGLHVWKLYGRDRGIAGILSGCTAALMSTMASNGAQFTHVDFSPPAQQYLNFYGCIAAGKPDKSIAPTIIFWSAPLVFSLVALGLALYRCLTTREVGGNKISVVRALLRDGIWYLSVPVVVNLVSVILASQTANPNLHNFNAAGSISLNFVMANRLMLSNFRNDSSPTSSMTPGSRETPRFNPTFPSNNFAVCSSSPAVPTAPTSSSSVPRRTHGDSLSDDLEEDEKYDRNLDIEAHAGSAGGIEMERKCSGATTLADNRSIRSKQSDVTFQITGGSSGQSGIEEDDEKEIASRETLSDRV